MLNGPGERLGDFLWLNSCSTQWTVPYSSQWQEGCGHSQGDNLGIRGPGVTLAYKLMPHKSTCKALSPRVLTRCVPKFTGTALREVQSYGCPTVTAGFFYVPATKCEHLTVLVKKEVESHEGTEGNVAKCVAWQTTKSHFLFSSTRKVCIVSDIMKGGHNPRQEYQLTHGKFEYLLCLSGFALNGQNLTSFCTDCIK